MGLIQDTEKNLFRIPDPGVTKHRIPDPKHWKITTKYELI